MASGSNNLNQSLKALLEELNTTDDLAVEVPKIEEQTTQLRAGKFDMCTRLSTSGTLSSVSIVVKHLFARQKECNKSLDEYKDLITTAVKNSSSEMMSTKNQFSREFQELIDVVAAPHGEVLRMTNESDAEDREKIDELNQRLDRLDQEYRDVANLLNILKTLEAEQRRTIEASRKNEAMASSSKS